MGNYESRRTGRSYIQKKGFTKDIWPKKRSFIGSVGTTDQFEAWGSGRKSGHNSNIEEQAY